jgi:hypothetical protein
MEDIQPVIEAPSSRRSGVWNEEIADTSPKALSRNMTQNRLHLAAIYHLFPFKVRSKDAASQNYLSDLQCGLGAKSVAQQPCAEAVCDDVRNSAKSTGPGTWPVCGLRVPKRIVRKLIDATLEQILDFKFSPGVEVSFRGSGYKFEQLEKDKAFALRRGL